MMLISLYNTYPLTIIRIPSKLNNVSPVGGKNIRCKMNKQLVKTNIINIACLLKKLFIYRIL